MVSSSPQSKINFPSWESNKKKKKKRTKDIGYFSGAISLRKDKLSCCSYKTQDVSLPNLNSALRVQFQNMCFYILSTVYVIKSNFLAFFFKNPFCLVYFTHNFSENHSSCCTCQQFILELHSIVWMYHNFYLFSY